MNAKKKQADNKAQNQSINDKIIQKYDKTVKIIKKICIYGNLCYNKKECTYEYHASKAIWYGGVV